MPNTIKRTVRVSEAAFHEIKRRAGSDPMYQSRGAVGVIDYLLFGKFTNRGRGCFAKKTKKTVDKR